MLNNLSSQNSIGVILRLPQIIIYKELPLPVLMINNVTAALDVSDNMFNEGVNVLNDVVSTHVNWITLLKGDNYKHCGTVTSKQNSIC